MIKLATSMFVLVFSVMASMANATTDASVVERIAPVGKVCVAGTECAAAGAAPSVASGPRSGADVYNTYCAACHGTGAMGAPKSGDKAVWSERLAKGFNKTLANAINGLNMMPAKGTCMDCSDDEIGGAIKHMSK